MRYGYSIKHVVMKMKGFYLLLVALCVASVYPGTGCPSETPLHRESIIYGRVSSISMPEESVLVVEGAMSKANCTFLPDFLTATKDAVAIQQ